MIKTKKIKWRRLLNELEYLYEEWELLDDINKSAGGEFEAYYREFCARNGIDLNKLNDDNKERLSDLYGKPPEEVEETPISEYSGSASIVKVDIPEEEPAVEEQPTEEQPTEEEVGEDDVELPEEEIEYTDELTEAKKKPVPTSPDKWSRAKAKARSKFDVYPSAYANAYAAKEYKKMGGGWRMGKPKKK